MARRRGGGLLGWLKRWFGTPAREPTGAHPTPAPPPPSPDAKSRAPEPPAVSEPRITHTRGRVPADSPATEEAELAHPDGREAAGAATQFPGHDSSEVTDLVVGLDFGTSSTKVVIQSPFQYRGRAVAVPFLPELEGGSAYLLPTTLFERQDGTVSLEADATAREHANLKVKLMDEPDSVDARCRSAAYLALVLRQARAWLLETQKEEYGQFQLRWSVNLGIPSAGYDDDVIRDSFARVARAAWAVSLRDKITLLDASRALDPLDDEVGSDDAVAVAVIPEIAAEVVGYAKSPQRDPGLHVMVDVGASTLDICGFVLHDKMGGDQYDLLTAEVCRLGAQELHRTRLEALRRIGVEATEVEPLGLLAPVPERGEDYVGAATTDLRQEMREEDAAFQQQCTNALMRTLMALRKSRDIYSHRWDAGLPVFLCGGGASMKLYEQIIPLADARFKKATRTRGIYHKRLAQPRNFSGDGLNEDVFRRLAVAYGLSFDSFDIGEIRPPHEIEDMVRSTRSGRNEFISKDQV